MMTLREQWQENRRRRANGEPEIDRQGNVIVPKKHEPIVSGPHTWDSLYESYDPNSPNYRSYQGD